MTIAADAAIWFYGSQVDLGNTPGAVSAGAFSAGTSDLNIFTNVDDATHVAITLEMDLALAADDNSGCSIYFRALNVDGSTADDEVPEAEYPHTFMGFIPALNLTTDLQRSTIGPIALPINKTSSLWEVYVRNQTGQAFITTTWTVYITPMSLGPHGA